MWTMRLAWRRKLGSYCFYVLVCVLCVVGPSAHGSELRWLGVERLSVEQVRAVLPDPPDTWTPDAASQVEEAVLELYVAQGYAAARVETHIEGSTLVVDVDEGHIARVVIKGVDPYQQMRLGDNIQLDDGVLLVPQLEEQLERLKNAHPIRAIEWNVTEGDELSRTELGTLRRDQVLVVKLALDDDTGVVWGAEIDPTWGTLGRIGWRGTDLAADGDRFTTAFTLGIPLEEYIFEEEPQLRWTYGELMARYRSRPIGRSIVSPALEVNLDLAQFHRLDLDLEQAMVFGTHTMLWMGFRASDLLHQDFGIGVSTDSLLSAREVLGAPPPPPLSTLVRPLLASRTRLTFPNDKLRLDLQDKLDIELSGGVSLEAKLFWRAWVRGQWVQRVRRDFFIVKGRSWVAGGDVRFFDEEPLAGKYQRVYHGNYYWARVAAQLDVEYRFRLVRNVFFGIWHDITLFEDNTIDPGEPRYMNGFGPSINLVVLDLFAVDVTYGFGFGPQGFSHNLGLALQSVY